MKTVDSQQLSKNFKPKKPFRFPMLTQQEALNFIEQQRKFMENLEAAGYKKVSQIQDESTWAKSGVSK